MSMSTSSRAGDSTPNSPRRPPGPIREAHAHLAALGESLELVSLAACASLAECLGVVRQAAEAAGPGASPFVRLHSARVQGWPEARWPTLSELDVAAGAMPVVIMSFDHHSAAANTAAFKLAGLRGGEPVPPNGVVVTEAGTTEPTGLLLEQAAYAAWRAAPEPTPDEQRRYVRAALAALAALGYREVHDLHSQVWLGPLLAELERAGELSLDVGLYSPADRLAADVAAAAAWTSQRVRLLGGKVFADGTLNARTALMIHRYAEPLLGFPRGQCLVSPAELGLRITEADGLGLHLAVHAIGDGAVRTVLDAIERAAPRTAGFRIEHAELIDVADVPRFARLGVVCSVQPCHLLADVEALNRFVPHRLDRVLPLRELIDSGCRPGELLWFGSDVPIVGADPGDSVQAAVYRRRAGASEAEMIAPRQAITEQEAWACFAPGAIGRRTI